MLKQNPKKDRQDGLFRPRLENIIDPRHELVKLAALIKLAKEQDIPLRQSYRRKGKQAHFMANRYMAARQMKRGRKKIKEVRNYLGRVMRNIKSVVDQGQMLSPALEEALGKAEIIYNQTLNPKTKHKLYSWRAPEVECIAFK